MPSPLITFPSAHPSGRGDHTQRATPTSSGRRRPSVAPSNVLRVRVLRRLVEQARRLPPTALDGSLALALVGEGLLDYRALGPSIYPPGSVVGGPLAIVFLIVEIV